MEHVIDIINITDQFDRNLLLLTWAGQTPQNRQCLLASVAQSDNGNSPSRLSKTAHSSNETAVPDTQLQLGAKQQEDCQQ